MDALAADHVVTGTGSVLAPGWVGFEAGRIREVAEGAPPRELRVEEGGPGSILIPGLVSAHTHLALGGLRHVADDRPFLEWILRGIVPGIEAGSRDPGFFLAGARASARELLEGGVTLVGDNFLRAEGAEALRETGQKGIYFQEVFGSLAADEESYLVEMQAGLDRLPSMLGGFPFGYSPHTPWTCPARVFQAAHRRARDEGRRLSFHLDESEEEHRFLRDGAGPIAEMIARRGTASRYRFGATPTASLEELGVLGPEGIAAHAVHVTPEDIAILARRRVAVVHCPSSNLKLAEGIAPVAAMLEAGVEVALGVDSAASTGKLDLFEEMRLALLVQRGASRRIGPMTAAQVLDMATAAGARALGFADTGTLEPGKSADLVLLRADRPRHGPVRDAVATVVYTCTPEDVALVVIDGAVRHRRAR